MINTKEKICSRYTKDKNLKIKAYHYKRIIKSKRRQQKMKRTKDLENKTKTVKVFTYRLLLGCKNIKIYNQKTQRG
jgi:hypothetical protein